MDEADEDVSKITTTAVTNPTTPKKVVGNPDKCRKVTQLQSRIPQLQKELWEIHISAKQA
jgi:hypothetical protein